MTLSDSVVRFLTEEIRYVERLDVLLAVRRHAERWWAAQAVSTNLGMSVEAVQGHLEQLSARNLLAVRIADAVIYRYQPGTSQLSGFVDAIVQSPDAHREALKALMAHRPADSVRLFADAFRFRKRDPHA